MTGSLRHGALGAGLLLLLLTLAPLPARAADPVTGGLTVALDGNAAAALKRAGVRFVAVAPAAVTRRSLTLPASTATVGTTARVSHTGVVQLVRGRGRQARRVAITGARTRLAARRSGTSARLGTRRVPLLTFAPVAPTLDPATGGVRIRASVSLTRTAARALVRRLGLRRLPVRRLGTATLAVARPVAAAPPAVAPPTAGVPAGNVTAASLTWRPRESFVRYMNSEPGNGLFVSEGATEGPRETRPPSDAPLVYSFLAPFAGGTTDGTTTQLAFSGRVSARWASRGIDLQFANPTLTLGAGASAAFVMGGATSGGRNGQVTRVLDLDVAAAASHTVDGATETYVDIPATLTPEGAEGFAGFYPAGTAFGTVTTSFTRTP